MNEIINQRSELLFCYDIKDANPNGDPLDENKPRIDEETGKNIVTDVRLKRTIRDYLMNYKGYNGENENDIFVREIADEKGIIQDGKTRANDFDSNPDNVLKACIDIRLFGGVIPLDKDSITYTGPVQFKMGRSLHQVNLVHIKGTGAFASGKNSKQKTFREEYVLPYSFICFHGIINENAAKHTHLTKEDIHLFIEGMWKGTKNLISRSKFGQQPRLLLKINYNAKGFFIGDLDSLIKLESENESKIRNITEFSINADALNKKIDENRNKISDIEYIIDRNININIDFNDDIYKAIEV